jgi:hypothetical protein
MSKHSLYQLTNRPTDAFEGQTKELKVNALFVID